MTQTWHFKELKNIIEHIYSRIEIKGIAAKKDDNLIKEKLKNLGFTDIENNKEKEKDKEENKKLSKSLNIDFYKIETIEPMELMGNNPNLDTLDFKQNHGNFSEEEDEEENLEQNENEQILNDISNENEKIKEDENEVEQEESDDEINGQEKKMTEKETLEIKKI